MQSGTSLDIVVDHGDPIADMTRHRTETHALFYLTLAAPLVAAAAARLYAASGKRLKTASAPI